MSRTSDAPGMKPPRNSGPLAARLHNLRAIAELFESAESVREIVELLAAHLEEALDYEEAACAVQIKSSIETTSWKHPLAVDQGAGELPFKLEAPFEVAGRSFGSAIVRRTDAFSDVDEAALSLIANVFGAAVDRVLRLERHPRELKGILEIAQSLTAAGDLPDLFGVLPERVAMLVGAQRCFVATYEVASGRLVARAPGFNVDAEMVSSAKIPFDLPSSTHEPVSTAFFRNEVVTADGADVEFLRNWNVESILCAPIRAKGTDLGVLYALDKPGGFDEEDARLAAIVAAHAAEAMANEKLLESVHAQARREALLNRITAAVRESLELDEILMTTVRMLGRSLDLCRAYIAFVDRDRGVASVTHEALAPGITSTAGEFPIAEYGDKLLKSLERGEVLVVDDVATDPRVAPFRARFLDPLLTKSMVYVPVIRESTLLAVIGFSQVRSTRRWSPEEIALARAVADQLAVALRQSSLFAKQRRAVDHRALIGRINAAVRESLDLDVVLQTTVQELGTALGADRCYVLAPGPFPATVETATVRFEYCRPGAPGVRGVKMPIRNRAREGPVLNVEEPLAISDIALNPRLVSRRKADLLALTDTRSLLSVRAIYGDQVLGIIELNQCFDARTWTAEEIELVGEVAAQLAVAIHNAQLFRRVTSSEQQWHTTFNSMTDGLALLDPTGQVVRLNESMLKFCGITDSKAAIGRYYYELLHGEESDSTIRRVLTTSQRVQVERDIPARGLSLRESIDPIFDEGGTISGLVVVVRDVTREREADRAIRYRNRQLAALNAIAAATTHTLDIAEIVEGAFGRIVDVTAADLGAILIADEGGEFLEPMATHGGAARVASLLGRDPKSGVAAAVFESDTPLTLGELAARFSIHQQQPEQEKIHSGLLAPIRSRQRPLGILAVGYLAEHVFSANERQLLAVAGQQLGVAVENARLIANLQSALERVREANRVKDEFLAVVSHELRTPLTAIQGWSEVLQDPDVEKTQLDEGLDAIHYASASLTQLISDLLDLSRIEHNVLRLELQPVDPNYPVRAAVSTLGQIAESKGVELSVDLTEDLPLVHADPGRMQQVIWNLLVNAIKFTPGGGHVWVSTELDSTAVRILVTDDGTGISSEFLPHVFDRFTQADGSPTRQFGGLGLGLSLVRSLVEAHGGEVVAFSGGKGQGATFTVSLPIPS